MPDWRLDGAGQEYEGATPSSSAGTSLTANASANTKSTSWTQLIASTSFDYQGLIIMLGNSGVTARAFLVDIAIGAASSEQVILPNLLYSVGSPVGAVYAYYFPIHIPAGSRLSARCQCTNGASTMKVQLVGHAAGVNHMSALGVVNDLGSATGSSGGVNIDPGGSTNTKGSWTQITSSCPSPISLIQIAIGQQENSARVGTYNWTLDIAIGGAGSEQIIIPDLSLSTDSVGDQVNPNVFPPIPVDIPSGTRIAARSQCSGNDASDRLFDVIIFAQ